MTDPSTEPTVLDLLVEQTGEGPEQGQPDAPQDPAWRPSDGSETLG